MIRSPPYEGGNTRLGVTASFQRCVANGLPIKGEDMSDKDLRIEFAPGAFDEFEGTQEELNDLVAEIKNLALHGNLHENSYPVDMDALAEEDPELHQILTDRLNSIEQNRKN